MTTDQIKWEREQARIGSRPELLATFLAAVVGRDKRTASAVKRGRNRDFPFVPVLKLNQPTGIAQTKNPCQGLAFATREEALDCAQKTLDGEQARLAKAMTTVGSRALREQFGFPRELTDMEAGA